MSASMVNMQDYVVPGEHFSEVAVPTPKLGGKCWLLEKKGIFVLARGSGTLRTIACTNAGSGSLLVLDGLPDENGQIPEDALTRRLIYKANPVVMGSWMLDAGFEKGLTIKHTGGQNAVACTASIVWVAFVAAKK